MGLGFLGPSRYCKRTGAAGKIGDMATNKPINCQSANTLNPPGGGGHAKRKMDVSKNDYGVLGLTVHVDEIEKLDCEIYLIRRVIYNTG